MRQEWAGASLRRTGQAAPGGGNWSQQRLRQQSSWAGRQAAGVRQQQTPFCSDWGQRDAGCPGVTPSAVTGPGLVAQTGGRVRGPPGKSHGQIKTRFLAMHFTDSSVLCTSTAHCRLVAIPKTASKPT